MPIINGQKMACEPCIRGHRSTKCNHANERLMVPVRKPGRPLSLCPHPPSRQCGCAGVTAAIPRKQTCRCGTKPGAPPPGGPSSKAASPATTPGVKSPKSPTKPAAGSAAGSSRIQKSSKPPARKPSVDPARIERMDAAQVNIMPSFETRQQHAQAPDGASFSMHHMPAGPVNGNGNGNGYSPVPMSPHHAPPMSPHHAPPHINHTAMYPFYPHQVTSAAGLDHSMQPGPANGHRVNGSSTTHHPPSSGHNPQLASHGPAGLLHQRPGSGGGATEQKKGSCCSSQTKPMPGVGYITGLDLQQPGPGAIGPNMTPNQQQAYPAYFPHPTIFTYPPHYGSYLQPLLPESWKQAMGTMMAQSSLGGGGDAHAHAHAHANAHAHAMATGPSDLSFMATGTSTPAPATPVQGTSHVCTCGEACQCVGCAAHPYNDATQDYVRSAWNLMTDDAWASGVASPMQGPSQFHSHAGGHHHPADANGGGSIPNGSGGSAGGCCGPAAAGAAKSPTPQTPSDTSEEQTLSASDFLFVTYPFGDSCVGETALCPCGDDCQCLGCVVHGNHLPGGSV